MLFFYWSHQISSSFQWVDVTDDCVRVSSSHIIISQMIQCQYCSHDNTFYQTALFITEMIQTVFVYRKCSASIQRQLAVEDLQEENRSLCPINQNPDKHFLLWMWIGFCHCGTISVHSEPKVTNSMYKTSGKLTGTFIQVNVCLVNKQYFTMKVTVMLFHVFMNCGTYYCVR